MSFMSIAATTVGIGLSAAGAAGAFSKHVDPNNPTGEEGLAAQYARKVFSQGQGWQQQLDPIYLNRLDKNLERIGTSAAYLGQAQKRLGGLKQEMGALDRGPVYQAAADRGVSAAWQAMPDLQAGLTRTAARTGGPGSGAWLAQMGEGGSAMGAALAGANTRGRLGQVDELMRRRGQYGGQMDQFGNQLAGFGQQVAGQVADTQGLFNDYSGRVKAGLGLMTQGAGEAARSQQARINAQNAQNIALNQGMGQIGGSLTSAGMMGLSAMGGDAGGMGGGMAPTGAGDPYGGYVFANPGLYRR